jgi:hypothetical protein
MTTTINHRSRRAGRGRRGPLGPAGPLGLLCAAALAVAACDSAVGPDLPRLEPGGARYHTTGDARNVVLVWNDALLESIRTGTLGPPQTARALGTVHTAMYDAWAAYDALAVGTILGGTLRRPLAEHTEASKREAVSYAAYRVLVDLYPERTAAFGALLQQLGYDPANGTTDVQTPAGVGNVAADALLAFRASDGANQSGGYADYTGYAPVNSPDQILDPERWQPLRNLDGSAQTFITPHWANVTAFGLTTAGQFRPPPPAPYRSGEYQRQVEEVILLSAKLGDREKMVAEYWADGPQSELPPGHWNLFAQVVSLRDGHTLDDDVKLFFALNNALCDASIAAWEAKRHYDYVRPITAVRYLKGRSKVRAWAGPYQGTRVIEGAAWQPYQVPSFVTPPFSEYVSGHSTFSAAAAEVLRRFTGSDYFGHSVTLPAGWSRIEPGATPALPVTLSWTTFSDAADEAGISRLYGGIHFRQGDLEGRALGRKVGTAVWERAQAHINGTL